MAGSLTTTVAIIQLLPCPVFAGPGASRHGTTTLPAPFLPRLLNSGGQGPPRPACRTVRFPGWAMNPQARPQNVRNDGAVNNRAGPASSVISDEGTGSAASPASHRTCQAARRAS